MKNEITAILVDDERSSREVLRSLLNTFCKEIVVLGEASNVEDAYTLINDKKPQLVFLDIEMRPNSGFTLLKKFTEVPFDVIFVTSYDKYAINAIKFNALDYLLKPVEVKDLQAAVERAKQNQIKKSGNGTQVINLLKTIDDASEKRITVHSGENVRVINQNDIIYIDGEGRYSNIYVSSGERFPIARNLKDFEEYLSDDVQFMRIHKSCIINLRFLKQYSKGDPCIVEMGNGVSFEVARRKKQDILERLRSIR